MWKIKLTLDEIDVSENLINSMRIEAEEGTAKIAEFSLIPFAGPISVTKWIGKLVNISYLNDAKEWILFQGVVDEPIYDPTTKITTFICTDQLQEKIQNLSKFEVDELINGYWSHLIFDDKNDNCSYVQDQLTTIPVSLDLDNRNQFQLTPWQAKLEPDFTFTEDDVLYQSMQVQLANRRELHNQTIITFQYRYPRLKQREILFDYRYPLGFCEQNNRNATLPNVTMIEQAIAGTGWLLKNKIEYEHQRGPGWVNCNGVTFGFIIKEETRKFLVREAKFTLMKRFVQTVTENIQFQIQAPQSINQFSKIDHYESAHYEHAIDATKYLNAEKYQSPQAGSIVDSEGDYVFEVENRQHFNHAVITKLNQSKTAILKSHRNNLITFKSPIQPLVERSHTIKLDTTNVQAQGKVKHIIHECDFNQGSCVTTITFAVSRTDDDNSVVDSILTLPSKISLLGEPGNLPRIDLSTNLGGRHSSQSYDESWDGYTGNENGEPGAKTYPEKFAITTPSIDSAQAPVEHYVSRQYHINIPNELLLLSA